MLESITGQFVLCESYLIRIKGFLSRFLIDFHDFENIVFNFENFKSKKIIKILHF